jgi:hypothetical protein
MLVASAALVYSSFAAAPSTVTAGVAAVNVKLVVAALFSVLVVVLAGAIYEARPGPFHREHPIVSHDMAGMSEEEMSHHAPASH